MAGAATFAPRRCYVVAQLAALLWTTPHSTSVNWSRVHAAETYSASGRFLFRFLEGLDTAPHVVGAPDSRAEALDLDDLTVVDELFICRAVFLDVPGEHCRIRSLEHDPFETECVGYARDDVGPPRL